MANELPNAVKVVNMQQCPRCSKEWIEEYALVCAHCEPQLAIDLAIHELHRSIATIQNGSPKYLAKHKEALLNLSRLFSQTISNL